MTELTDAVNISLPPFLGGLILRVSGSPVTIAHQPVAVPKLPEGMAVEGAALVSVHLTASINPHSPLRLTINADAFGDAETGEWLDSMSFRSEHHVVQVAVRDRDWLSQTRVGSQWVTYQPQGFTQIIHEAPTGTVLHVGVAWRSIAAELDENDISTWWAVDLVLPY